jgi:DNA-directed RNA polymerase specialized sigma24 family protein
MPGKPADASSDDDGWRTSDTFIADIYSGDEKRCEKAFERFVEARYDELWRQIHRGLSAYPGASGEVGRVLNDVLIRLFHDILKRGWSHSRGTTFRGCAHQLAKFAIADERRRQAKSREVQTDFEDSCWEALSAPVGQLVEDFWLRELLETVQSRVRGEFSERDWTVWTEWCEREGLLQSEERDSNERPSATVTDANERQIRKRIRDRIREELQRVAEREGWDVVELFRG